MQIVHLVIVELTNQFLQNHVMGADFDKKASWLEELRSYLHLFTNSQC